MQNKAKTLKTIRGKRTASTQDVGSINSALRDVSVKWNIFKMLRENKHQPRILYSAISHHSQIVV